MWRENRHKEILDIVSKEKTVDINSLAEKFQLSIITIRNDIRELSKKGLINRRYGKVSMYDSKNNEDDLKFSGTPFDNRKSEDFDIKRKLASFVFSKILKVSSIFIDDSSTVSHLLPMLKNTSGITVITPSILAIEYLSYVPNVHTIGLGGTVCTIHKAFIGSIALEQMSKHNVDLAIFGCYGISPEFGCLENVHSIVDIKKQAALNSKENIVLLSSNKWERDCGVNSVSWNNISQIISNNAPKSEKILNILEKNNIKLHIV